MTDLKNKTENLIQAVKSCVEAIFPKPRWPQKRYLILVISVIYCALKLYVAHTPDKYDDELLDEIHQIALQVLSEQVTENNSMVVVDPNSTKSDVELDQN